MHARLSRIAGAIALLNGIVGQATAQRVPTAVHRAILVSFDGFSEERLREYADSASAPHLFAMFASNVCAESVRPAFPSVTPTSHASIWTGAYSDVNGISAQTNAALPVQDHTLLDYTDGYKAAALRAEPIWTSAARQGKVVFSHMATQSPQPAAYTPIDRSTPALDSSRARAARAEARDNIAAVNTYNDQIEPARVVTRKTGLDWAFGKEGDSLHAVVRGDNAVVVHRNADVAHGVTVHLATVDTTDPHTRPLARRFSAPLAITMKDGRRTFVYFRLFQLSKDSLLMYVSEGRVIEANHPKLAAAYDAAVQGVPGNGGHPAEHGDLGRRLYEGGDGTAERRGLEIDELIVRQFMAGTEWGWRTYHPELETDYTPYPDEVLHEMLGFADPGTPGVSPTARRIAAEMLKRVYRLVDVRLEQFERLASSAPNTQLFVVGEHGMRPAWVGFRGNIALRDAGLLALDAKNGIDLAHTQASMSPGTWIVLNRVMRKQGIVPPDSEQAVIERVIRAIQAVRDSAGQQVVTRIFRPGTAEGDSLGIGAPGGGDVYFELAPGYYYSAALTGSVLTPLASPHGEHGYPSIDRDMQPVLCIVSHSGPRRLANVRTIDIAPTVSAWLGIAPPAESRGHVLPVSR